MDYTHAHTHTHRPGTSLNAHRTVEIWRQLDCGVSRFAAFSLSPASSQPTTANTDCRWFPNYAPKAEMIPVFVLIFDCCLCCWLLVSNLLHIIVSVYASVDTRLSRNAIGLARFADSQSGFVYNAWTLFMRDRQREKMGDKEWTSPPLGVFSLLSHIKNWPPGTRETTNMYYNCN